MEPGVTVVRQAGMEPVPGYRLIELIGQGGFGEVWKCEAPGGLYKAIKFVKDSEAAGSPARQERAALERVKLLRHPFILSLERVEVVNDDLVVVMELADESLHSLFTSYRDRGQVGLPREQLLGYLLEAAEALDWMNFEHGLQHLDVKPHNLFVVSKHIKVADFGLVHAFAESAEPTARRGGVTPLYSAPELLRGTLSRQSDQYSLAVVYQQLLTGTVPFWNVNIYDLMMQHLTAEPDLSALSEMDRPIVARALAKVPEHRFPSCQEFINTLQASRGPTLRSSGLWRQVLVGEKHSGHAAQSTPTSASDATRRVTKGPLPPPPPSEDPSDTSAEMATRRLRAVRRDQLDPNELARQALSPPSPVATTGPITPSARLDAETPSRPGQLPASSEQGDSREKNLPTPTAISLPGYRFVNCLNQTSLGDLWRAEDAEGRPRRALCLLGFVRYDNRLISHLRALRDPALPNTEVHWSPAERLVILTDWMEGTLRDRFEQRQAEGHRGIPRDELIALLRTLAEAIDSLYARHGLLHLGIHPRNLLVGGERLWLADFGVIPLVWLPTGQSAAALNGKYAAPELFDRRPSRSADQYSLALIYAEMLTGVHPRPQRPGSGSVRRIGNAGATRTGSTNRTIKLELDLLQVGDRGVVAKALSTDPAERYETCLEFVEALEQVGTLTEVSVDRYHELPPVIPFATLRGEIVGPETVLPSMATLIGSITRTRTPAFMRTVETSNNARYTILPDGAWVYRCPFAIFPGAMTVKVDGFRQHWNGRLLEAREGVHRLLMDVPIQRSLWERVIGTPPRLEVTITTETGLTGTRLTEAEIVIRYLGNADQQKRILQTIAPQVFESIRLYLQATPEHRTGSRFPFSDEVHIYPVLPDLDLAPTQDGVCRNLSQGGLSYRAAEKPPTEYLYLHLHRTSPALGYALLGRVVRTTILEQGWEIAVAFNTAPGREIKL